VTSSRLTLALLLVALALAVRWALAGTGPLTLVGIQTDHMAPELQPGALVVAESVPVQVVRPGDVIFLPRPQQGVRRLPLRVLRVSVLAGPPADQVGSAGRIFRLAGTSDSFGPPWEVEMHGRVLRVFGSVPVLGRLAGYGA
jgi:hypothetical protein